MAGVETGQVVDGSEAGYEIIPSDQQSFRQEVFSTSDKIIPSPVWIASVPDITPITQTDHQYIPKFDTGITGAFVNMAGKSKNPQKQEEERAEKDAIAQELFPGKTFNELTDRQKNKVIMVKTGRREEEIEKELRPLRQQKTEEEKNSDDTTWERFLGGRQADPNRQ